MSLSPLPFHHQLCSAIRANEPGLWEWFSSDQYEAEYADLVKLELLKSTYRLERNAHPALYREADLAADTLELDIPITLYQAVNSIEMNAGLCFVEGEGHIVLTGSIIEKLEPKEMRALLGHELSHYKLWTVENGSHRTTWHLITAIAADHRSDPSYERTAIRLQHFTEIYADRGALLVCEDPAPVISCLGKVLTGISKIDPMAFARQAKEVLSANNNMKSNASHPESLVRIAALVEWHEQHKNETTANQQIRGELTLDTLDLAQQMMLQSVTHTLVAKIRSSLPIPIDEIEAVAQRYLLAEVRADFSNEIPNEWHESIERYFSYFLLDFVTASPDLQDLMVALTYEIALNYGFESAYRKSLLKELKLKKADVLGLHEQKDMLAVNLTTITQNHDINGSTSPIATPDDALSKPTSGTDEAKS